MYDVRPVEEHAAGHTPDATSCPGLGLTLAAETLRHEVVVTHCAGRTRSMIAAQTLRMMSVPHVFALEGGTRTWLLAGLWLARGLQEHGGLVTAHADVIPAERFAARLRAMSGIARLTPQVLRGWLDRRRRTVYVLDVRSPREYARGHIPRAVAAPSGQAIQRADEIVGVRGAVVAVADGETAGSARAWATAYWLRRMGIGDVCVREGGVESWARVGYPVEVGPDPRAPLGWNATAGQTRFTNPRRLADALRSGDPLVLDVDTSESYASGHVPSARWLLRSWLEWADGRNGLSRAGAIVVTCHQDGVQSVYAAGQPRAMGYTNVTVLEGGMRAWRESGGPIETGSSAPRGFVDVVEPRYASRKAMERYLPWERALGAQVAHRAPWGQVTRPEAAPALASE